MKLDKANTSERQKIHMKMDIGVTRPEKPPVKLIVVNEGEIIRK